MVCFQLYTLEIAGRRHLRYGYPAVWTYGKGEEICPAKNASLPLKKRSKKVFHTKCSQDGKDKGYLPLKTYDYGAEETIYTKLKKA